MVRWFGGLGLLVAGFFLLPADKVDHYKFASAEDRTAAIAGSLYNGERPPQKSGLRIAVEGRLRWLGLTD